MLSCLFVCLFVCMFVCFVFVSVCSVWLRIFTPRCLPRSLNKVWWMGGEEGEGNFAPHLHTIQEEVIILPSSCYRNEVKLLPHWRLRPVCDHILPFTWPYIFQYLHISVNFMADFI